MNRFSATRYAHYAPYAVAIMTPLLAVVAALLFDPFIKTTMLFFIVAALFSAWYGGFKPGILSGVISIILLNYFLIEPRFELIPQLDDLPRIAVFSVVVIFLSIIEESRIRTEQALRQSRDQLRIVLEGIKDGVIAQSPAGQPIFANEMASKIIGYSTIDELLTNPLPQTRDRLGFYDQNGAVVLRSELPSTKAFLQGIAGQMVMRWTYANGDPARWINLRSTPVFDDLGKVQMAISIFSDITEIKHAEIELRNQHERVQTVLASISKCVISTDTEGHIDFINRMGEILTGWTDGQAIGKLFEDVVTIAPDKPGEAVINPVRTVLRDGAPVNVSLVHQLVSKSGDVVPIDYTASPIRDEFGSIMGTVTVIRDISDRVKAEKDRTELMFLLAAQQQRLKNILANIPGIVWESTIGTEGAANMNFVNDSVEKILGYTPDEWIENPNFGQTIIHPDDVESSAAQARELYESGNFSSSIQFRCIAKDGRVVPMEALYSILQDADGKVTGTCGLLMDISQRKADEIALKQSALDLRRSNEQLEQFAYVASHDLQEPLRMITSYLQLLERRYKDQLDADANEFINYAVDGASRMKALINDLLAYSRVKTGEQNFKEFSVQTLIDKVVTNLQMSIDEACAEITYDDLPAIKGDEAQFAQLFQNLMSNAIKFHGEDHPQVKIKAERQGKEWKFSVRDNGIGMETQYLDRIFVIFQRLHNKEQYPGTGIGLAICKKVVEHHGGRIWAESTPGTGTTFWFTIPIR